MRSNSHVWACGTGAQLRDKLRVRHRSVQVSGDMYWVHRGRRIPSHSGELGGGEGIVLKAALSGVLLSLLLLCCCSNSSGGRCRNGSSSCSRPSLRFRFCSHHFVLPEDRRANCCGSSCFSVVSVGSRPYLSASYLYCDVPLTRVIGALVCYGPSCRFRPPGVYHCAL